MARLEHPERGTVIEVGDDLADEYRTRGWADADTEKKPPRAPKKSAAGGSK